MSYETGWKPLSLNDVCILITDGSHTSPASTDNGYFMASVKDMSEYGFDFSNCRKISEKDYNILVKNGCMPQKGDVLIGKDGARFFEDIFIFRQDIPVVLLSSIAILRPNTEKITPEYLYYYLSNRERISQIKSDYGSGSAIPRIVLKDFRKLPISIPSIKIQNNITLILYALDTKTELNHRINKTLENMAQAIFKRWFVDFEFPDENGNPYKSSGGEMGESELGLIPKGWRVGNIDDISINYDYKRIPLSKMQREKKKGTYPYFGAAEIVDYIDEYVFDDIYLLLAEDGSVINEDGTPVLQYVWGKFWVNNHAHILQGKDAFSTEYLYLLFKQTQVSGIVSGAVQLKISQTSLRTLKLLLPNKDVLLAWNNIIEPMFSTIRVNKDQCLNLGSIRDMLLPKLMNGELLPVRY